MGKLFSVFNRHILNQISILCFIISKFSFQIIFIAFIITVRYFHNLTLPNFLISFDPHFKMNSNILLLIIKNIINTVSRTSGIVIITLLIILFLIVIFINNFFNRIFNCTLNIVLVLSRVSSTPVDCCSIS